MSARRVSISYLTSLLGIVTSLLNNVWLIRLVGLEVEKAEFGIYLFAVSLMAYFGLSQMGLDLASSQRIAEALAKGDKEAANRIYHQLTWFNRSLYFVLATAVATVALLCLFSGYSDRPQLVASIVALVGTGMGFRLLANPATAALAGSQNVHLVGAITLANSLCSTLLAYVLLRNGAGILCLPGAQAIVSVLSLLALHYMRCIHCPWSRERVVDLWDGFGRLLRFAVSIAACAMLGMVDASSDPILFQIGAESPLIEIATFNIWNRFPALTLVVAASLLASAGPTLASKMQLSRTEGLAFHRNLLWLSGGIGSCATVGLCIWLVPFMHHWMSGVYDISSAKMTAIGLAAAIGCRALMSSLACVFYPLDRVNFVIKGYAVLAATKVIVGVFLVRLMPPVTGMAWANAGAAFASSIYFAYMLHQSANYGIRPLCGVFIMMALSLVVGVSMADIASQSSMWSMVLGIAATIVALGGAYLILVTQLGIFSLIRFLPAKS